MRERRRPLAAFSNGNFRRFWFGQVTSNIGTWFQNLALSLVVLDATGSGGALALVTVAQFTPVLLLGPLAGSLADKRSPRAILISCSAVSAGVAGALSAVIAPDRPVMALFYSLVAVGGVVQVFERAAAQAFVYELVGRQLLPNAVALVTVAVSAARSVGPAAAGVAFALFGPTACLLVNALSYGLILMALLGIPKARLYSRAGTGTTDNGVSILDQLRQNTGLRSLLVVAVLVSLTAMSLMVTVTSMVSLTFQAGPEAVGAAHALNAVGAIVGGLLVSGSRAIRPVSLSPVCALLACFLALSAVAPSLTLFLVLAPLLGLALGLYQGGLQSAAQSLTRPESMGRMMALFTMATFGLSPAGAAIAGALIDLSSSRAPMLLGASILLGCAVALFVVGRRPPPDAPATGHVGA